MSFRGDGPTTLGTSRIVPGFAATRSLLFLQNTTSSFRGKAQENCLYKAPLFRKYCEKQVLEEECRTRFSSAPSPQPMPPHWQKSCSFLTRGVLKV